MRKMQRWFDRLYERVNENESESENENGKGEGKLGEKGIESVNEK